MTILFYLLIYIVRICNSQHFIKDYYSQYIKSNPISLPVINGFILLTESSLEEAFQLYDKLFIIFIESYDEHKFLPVYKELIKQNLFDSYKIAIGKLDASIHKNILKKYKLYGSPHKILFTDHGKNKIHFNGKDSINEIRNFLRKNNEDPLIHIKTKKQINELITNKPYSLIYFGDNEEKITFIREKSKKDIYKEYAYCDNYEIYKNYENIKNDSLMYITPFDEQLYFLYGNEINDDNIDNFIKNNTYPAFTKDINLIQKAYNERYNMLFVVRDIEDNYIDSFFKNISKNLKGQFIISIIDKNDKNNINLIKEIKYPNPNTKIQITISDKEKYYLNQTLSEKNFMNFLNKYLDGDFYKIKKSEEIPKEQTENVYKIVSKSLYKEVIRNDKDVFLKLYSPRCGHCISMAQDWRLLGNTFSKIKEQVRIAEMNLLLNEFNLCRIGVYPALFFFKNGSKGKILRYKGKYYYGDMKKFVIENSSRELEDRGEFVYLKK